MIAYIFPGQGSQFKGMGKDLFGEFGDLVRIADDVLGYSIEVLCGGDPLRNLSNTKYSQPALYVVNAFSYYKYIESSHVKPNYHVGHSLGEYNALLASGVFDFKTGLELVKKRGELMSEMTNGGMAAVIGLESNEIVEILNDHNLSELDVANFNTPTQIVVSGPKQSIIDAQLIFEKHNARYVVLNVSGAFHSRIMQSSAERYLRFLHKYEFNSPAVPVIANITARPYQGKNVMEYLAKQITGSVRWFESIHYLLNAGVDDFVEIGPGEVLSGLVYQIKQAPIPKIEVDHNDCSSEQSIASFAGNSGQYSANDREYVFMYGGQGSQYYNMGRELYETNLVFRKNLDECNSIVLGLTGENIIHVIYGKQNNYNAFDNIIHTHPAIFSIGYALTCLLQNEGIFPDAVLGSSIGEYVAATVSGGISLESGLKLLCRQSSLLSEFCDPGGMLVILGDADKFDKYNQRFEGLTLAGRNYDNCYVVSGDVYSLNRFHEVLKQESVFSQLLAVKYPFHSNHIDVIRDNFIDFAETISYQTVNIPLYSTSTCSKVSRLDSMHLWNAVRRPIRFMDTLASIENSRSNIYLDLSPSGTLSNFVRHGGLEGVQSHQVINNFGQNIKTLAKLRASIQDATQVNNNYA